MKVFTFETNPPYSIEVGVDILPCFKKKNLVVLTDHNITKLYKQKLLSFFPNDSLWISIPPGEKSKTRKTKELVEDWMVKHQKGRDTKIVAIGGGVILDLAGFIASTYLRGIPYISIPTSLLAMIDASIGGKTGVNTNLGKNLIGAIYHPEKVIIDIHFLRTLPLIKLKEGLSEHIKHCCIANPHGIKDLLNDHQKILKKDETALEKTIIESIVIKKTIVQKDEKEMGLRQVLNFGHTIGHAIEVASKYKISHGKAVAMGMLAEGFLSYRKTSMEERELQTLKKLMMLYYPNLKFPGYLSKEKIKQSLIYDKKVKEKKVYFVLLEQLGKVYHKKNNYSFSFSDKVVDESISWMVKCLH